MILIQRDHPLSLAAPLYVKRAQNKRLQTPDFHPYESGAMESADQLQDWICILRRRVVGFVDLRFSLLVHQDYEQKYLQNNIVLNC